MGIRPPSLHVKSCSGEGCTVSANSVAGLQRLTQFPGPQAQRKLVTHLLSFSSIFEQDYGNTLAGTTYNDVLCVGMCPKMRPVGVMTDEERIKGQKLSCVKLGIFPDHARRHMAPETLHAGSCVVSGKYIYFKFHENRLRGFGAVEGRKSPSPIDKAHGLYNSLYYRTSRLYYYHLYSIFGTDCWALSGTGSLAVLTTVVLSADVPNDWVRCPPTKLASRHLRRKATRQSASLSLSLSQSLSLCVRKWQCCCVDMLLFVNYIAQNIVRKRTDVNNIRGKSINLLFVIIICDLLRSCCTEIMIIYWHLLQYNMRKR